MAGGSFVMRAASAVTKKKDTRNKVNGEFLMFWISCQTVYCLAIYIYVLYVKYRSVNIYIYIFLLIFAP